MKTWSKYLYHLSLATVICGASSIKSYAQETEVEQLEENLKIAETLKVYGKGTLQGAYSMENYPNKALFAPAYIGSKHDINPQSKFVFYFETRLGLKKTVYLKEKEILLNTELSLDKAGKTGLKKVYGKFQNWIVGLHDSNFSATDLVPGMLGGAPNASLVKSTMQVTFKQEINPSISYAIGVEEPSNWDLYPTIKEDKDKKEKDNQPNSGVPTFAANVIYNYPDKLGHIKLGGLANILSYYNKVKKDSFSDFSFGVSLGTKFNLNEAQTKLMANGVYGRGIGNYIFDLSLLENEQKTAYLQKADSKVKTLDAWGAYLALEHRWKPELRSTLTSGFVGTLEDTVNRTNKEDYKYGYYASVNVTYHPTEQFNFGIEYLHGNRTNLDNKHNKDTMSNCIQTVAVFKF